jgi:hypothetical protein
MGGVGPPSSPVCVVSTVNILSEVGWLDLHNLTDVFQQPFQLFRDGERTLLQVYISVALAPAAAAQFSDSASKAGFLDALSWSASGFPSADQVKKSFLYQLVMSHVLCSCR